ncbi:hypothetical protein C3L33_09938, partial [Rhododendron williamsianum]
MKWCELCSNPARIYCEADGARLCSNCDDKVHSANFLVAKHSGTSSAASVNPKPRGKPRERSSGPRSPSAAHASKTLAVKNRGEEEVWRQREGTKAMRPTSVKSKRPNEAIRPERVEERNEVGSRSVAMVINSLRKLQQNTISDVNNTSGVVLGIYRLSKDPAVV